MGLLLAQCTYSSVQYSPADMRATWLLATDSDGRSTFDENDGLRRQLPLHDHLLGLGPVDHSGLVREAISAAKRVGIGDLPVTFVGVLPVTSWAVCRKVSGRSAACR